MSLNTSWSYKKYFASSSWSWIQSTAKAAFLLDALCLLTQPLTKFQILLYLVSNHRGLHDLNLITYSLVLVLSLNIYEGNIFIYVLNIFIHLICFTLTINIMLMTCTYAIEIYKWMFTCICYILYINILLSC